MSHLPTSLTVSGTLTVLAATTLSGLALHAAPLPPHPAERATTVLTAQMKPMNKGMGMTMASGSFRKGEAPVTGGFTLSEEGGRKVLTLSADFKTNDMAPDLRVVFSPSPTPLATSKPPAYPLKAGSYTELARLKASKGAQSYVIPASIDLKAQRSVLIWCRKFNATMAWAPLKG